MTRSGSIAAMGALFLAYGVTALLCLRAARREGAAWRWVAALLVALLCERLLGLENLADDVMTGIARRHDWYPERRLYQSIAVVALGVAALGVAAILAWRLRGRAAGVRVGATAATSLAGFVLVRAVSLHQVDRALTAPLGPLRVGNLIELGLLAAVAAAAAANGARNGGG